MNELQRQAYLDAMGVEVYYPRLQLVGAMPSTQCEMPALPEQSVAATGVTAVVQARAGDSPVPSGRPASVSELLDIPVKAKDVSSVKPERVKTSPENTPSFSLSVMVIPGSLLVVDDCPAEQVRSHEYHTLLHNIVLALGLGRQPIETQPFQWPETMKGHIDQSAAAAGDALQSHLARRLELGATQYILLMGDAARRYAVKTELAEGALTPHDSHPVQLLATLSASRMLREVNLKRQLWQQLQPLYRAINNS